jgi:hypothetical protein
MPSALDCVPHRFSTERRQSSASSTFFFPAFAAQRVTVREGKCHPSSRNFASVQQQLQGGECHKRRVLVGSCACRPPGEGGTPSGTCFEPKLHGWLRELVKLRDVFMADPATAKLLPA